MSRTFRLYPFYCRAGHNVTADSLSRAASAELEGWTQKHQAARIYPVVNENPVSQPTQPAFPEWISTPPTPYIRPASEFVAVERHHESYAFCEAAREISLPFQRTDPGHNRIARQVTLRGFREFPDWHIHFVGGLAEDLQEFVQFYDVFVGVQCARGSLSLPT